MIDVAAQIDVSYDTIRIWMNRVKHMDEAKFESNNENGERKMKPVTARSSELRVSVAARSHAGIEAAYTLRVVETRA